MYAILIVAVIILIFIYYRDTYKTGMSVKSEKFSSTQEPLGRSLEMSPTVLGSYVNPEIEEITRYDTIIVPENYNSFDELNSRRIIKNQQLAKRAIDGIVRHTKNSYSKYFQEELDNNENQDWWSEEADPDQTDVFEERLLTEQPSYGY